MNTTATRTAAAVAARRRQREDKLARVEKVIGQLRREQARITVRAIAHRARVSPTFLYENPAARALVQAAAADNAARRDRTAAQTHERIEATWRERALNAENAIAQAHKEILTQRQRIGQLMGQLRDVDQMVSGESVQRLVSENASLKQQVRQLSQEHRSLQERLEASRSTNRFAERRIAALEAQLLDPSTPT
jgi:chromosome segregation ATPase